MTGDTRCLEAAKHNQIRPEHGIIEIHFTGSQGGEAMIQAIELTPVQGGE
jgi:hypothetical protein